jgi:DnaJ-class molecular chaperone
MEEPREPDMAAGDEAPPERKETGANICPDCHGSGRRDGDECPGCGGTGRVEEAVGGG